MPRRPRKKSCNGIYHIMLRGINKQTIFEDDQDRRKLLDTVKRYKNISGYKVFSYCLMDNHIHLLLKKTEETVSKAIQRISTSYVNWYNKKYERVGHLFQGRFRSENVENSNYFLTVLRYIHQNPVKAGLANDVFECKWTSIQEYVGSNHFVDAELGLSLFSPDRSRAIELFAAYMQEKNEDDCLEDFDAIKVSDSDVKSYMVELGILNSSMMQQMEKKKRDTIIFELKKRNGVSVRQLSRVTGISKSAIDRARGSGGTGGQTLCPKQGGI